MIEKMFKKARLLNKESDRELKISTLTNYKHSRLLHSIPIAINEVGEASKHYPIFFVKDAEGVVPFAILGLKEGENKFVNNTGEWRKGRYIPALIRAYPFILSKSSADNTNLNVVIDDDYEGINKKDGARIFDDEGNPNEFGNQIVKYLQDLYSMLETTKKIANQLEESELLQQVDATIEQSGQKFVLSGLLQIDAEKLNKLSDEAILKLAKSGALNLVYAHLNSKTNFQNF
jgi:hypothetical protein